jgi:hypothetical protein
LNNPSHIYTQKLPTTSLLSFGLIALVATILFCGIARDPEFYEPTIFVKYRPTIKLHFYTPIGESDLKIEDLSQEKRREELLYRDFVINQGVYPENLNRFWFLPPVLIQLTLTFLSLATRRAAIKKKAVCIHFFVNLILLVFAIALMLSLDNMWSALVALAILAANILTARFVARDIQ